MTFVDAHRAITGWRRVVYKPGTGQCCENCGAFASTRTLYEREINRHDPDEGCWRICWVCLLNSAHYNGEIRVKQ